VSKPDPSITANLLSQLPSKKTETPAASQVPGLHREHNVLPKASKPSAKSAEKSAVQGHTRSSNRGK
jgi:hypothetical protein